MGREGKESSRMGKKEMGREEKEKERRDGMGWDGKGVNSEVKSWDSLLRMIGVRKDVDLPLTYSYSCCPPDLSESFPPHPYPHKTQT